MILEVVHLVIHYWHHLGVVHKWRHHWLTKKAKKPPSMSSIVIIWLTPYPPRPLKRHHLHRFLQTESIYCVVHSVSSFGLPPYPTPYEQSRTGEMKIVFLWKWFSCSNALCAGVDKWLMLSLLTYELSRYVTGKKSYDASHMLPTMSLRCMKHICFGLIDGAVYSICPKKSCLIFFPSNLKSLECSQYT